MRALWISQALVNEFVIAARAEKIVVSGMSGFLGGIRF